MSGGSVAGTIPPIRLRMGRRLPLLRGLGWATHGAAVLGALTLLGFFLLLLYVLVSGSWSSIASFGWGFLSGSSWNPNSSPQQYGAWPAVEGTLITSALALAMAVPVSLGVALFLTDSAPHQVRRPLARLVELTATVPSVLFGFWAVVALAPVMRGSVEPALASFTGGFLFSTHPDGFDPLTASLVLAVMVVPTISAVSREALEAVPRLQRESALSLGATRWEAAKMAVLGPARSGILGGVLLGLGRAVGETIAVLMIIGTVYRTPPTLTSSGTTLASWIANSFLSPATPLEYSALIELGLVLLAISVAVNVCARLLLNGGAREKLQGWLKGVSKRVQKEPGLMTLGQPPRAAGLPDGALEPEFPRGPPARPAWLQRALDHAPVRRTRRRRVHLLFVGASALCLLLALLPLAGILVTALQYGGGDVVRPAFYTSTLPVPCNPGPGRTCALGGIGPAIQGTLLLLLVASVVAIPAGLLAGIYLAEYGKGPFSRLLSFLAEVLTGVPTILIGMFVFVVLLEHNPSGVGVIAGGLALGLLMLPIVVRTSEEALRSVPLGVREAALALGYPRHRVVGRVVLGSARGALLTGGLLSLSRAAGDTAALLFTVGYSTFWYFGPNAPMAALTPYIFEYSSSSYSNLQEAAWGAALVLLGIMLAIGLAARAVSHLASRGASAPAEG